MTLDDFLPGFGPPVLRWGQRDLRRLLVTGAMTVVRHASRRGETTDPWQAAMLARKPKKVVAVALANRTARTVLADSEEGAQG